MCADEVLKNDFLEELSLIDFEKEYDPLSKRFIKAVLLAQMWQSVSCIKDTDGIEDELCDAENYWKMYLETSDIQYKEMANDELRHAGILIKKSLAKITDESKKEKISQYEKKKAELAKKITLSSV